MRYETRLVVHATAAALPGVAVALALVWMGDLTSPVRVSLTIALLAVTVLLLKLLHDRITFPLRTLSNVIAALRENDYSLRLRRPSEGSAFGDVAAEANRLADSLREQRLESLESSALVRTVLSQLDAAIFLFDGQRRLQQMNRAAEQLLRVDAREVSGRTAEALGVASYLDEQLEGAVELTFPGGTGRWSIRRTTFRDKGRAHQLLAITDLSRALRDEELQAWQRLVRVLSHELNNSLASIQSTSRTLQQIVLSDAPHPEWRADAAHGFGIIASRAESLTRFTQSYARLARLPRPQFADVPIRRLVHDVAGLAFAIPLRIAEGPDVTVAGDADQLQQLLINLVQNAVDAALETRGGVEIGWHADGQNVEIAVLDEGPGLSATKNLFVPFFTTKPGGTGIGLVLSRQIAEAHGGTLVLQNREGAGCAAKLRLPLAEERVATAQSTAKSRLASV